MSTRFLNIQTFAEHIEKASQISFTPIGPKKIHGNEIQAAVLALFGKSDEGVSVLITRRTEHLEKHKGQMAFPGGHTDPEDLKKLGPVTTALRETHEEIGIPEDLIEIKGQIPSFATTTGFHVTTVFGVLKKNISEVRLDPNPHEIAETLWVPLKTLLDSNVYKEEPYVYQGVTYPIHVFYVGRHRIWGVTGAILRNILDRLEAVSELISNT